MGEEVVGFSHTAIQSADMEVCMKFWRERGIGYGTRIRQSWATSRALIKAIGGRLLLFPFISSYQLIFSLLFFTSILHNLIMMWSTMMMIA